MKGHFYIAIILILTISTLHPQDIINEMGAEGKFIVRDSQQQEVLIINEGDVSITGALKIEELEEGTQKDKVVVWSEEDNNFKVLYNMIPEKTQINASVLAADSWTEDGSGNIYRSTGYVGIGTTTPTRILDIQPSVSGSAQLMRESDSDLFAINLKSLSNRGELLLYKDGAITTKFTGFGSTYLNGGNVGIATSNPLSKLSVGGPGSNLAAIYAAGGSKYGVFAYDGNSDGRALYGLSTGTTGTGVYGAATNTGVIENYGGYFEASGDYGHGVHGLATGINGSGVYGWADNTGNVSNYGGYFYSAGGTGKGVYAYALGTDGHGVHGISVGTSGHGGHFEAPGLNGVGIVGKATSDSNGFPRGGIFEAGGDDGVGVYASATKTGPTAFNRGGVFLAVGDGGIGVIGTGTNTGLKGVGQIGVHGYSDKTSGIGVEGNCSFDTGWDFLATGSGVDYGTFSSIRWKNNIVEIDNPLDKISEIRGVYFNWDEEHGGKRDIGCIAEEVGKVLPEIVVYEENGIDADGMDYSKLTPLLVEVAKAQQNLIEDLIKRIEYLESN